MRGAVGFWAILLVSLSTLAGNAGAEADSDAALCRSALTPPSVRLRACTAEFERRPDGAARAEILINRGSARLDRGEADLALVDFSAAIALDADNALAFNARGIAHHRSGNFRSAVRDYEAALKRDIDYAAAFHNRARAWLALAELERAERDFSAVIELRPDSARGFAGRGRVRYLRQDYWMAYRDLLRALEIDADDGYSLLWSRLTLRRLDAEAVRAKRLPLVSAAMETWPRLLISMVLGEEELATALDAARASDQAQRKVRECEARYYAGQMAELERRPGQAAEHYREALEVGDPGSLEYSAAALALRQLEAIRPTGAADQ